ncbi:MAG: hypothetical protein JWR77_663 [Rhizorhabdus sp.]|nr:hypothetical protein [Rhizorhabdus sp.]
MVRFYHAVLAPTTGTITYQVQLPSSRPAITVAASKPCVYPAHDMSRASIITSLIRLDRPLPELRAALAELDWDAEPVATLTRSNIAAILHRFVAGDLDSATVEAWANLVECREDVVFEPRNEEAVADALYDLANPDLQGPLEGILPDLLATLGG